MWSSPRTYCLLESKLKQTSIHNKTTVQKKTYNSANGSNWIFENNFLTTQCQQILLEVPTSATGSLLFSLSLASIVGTSTRPRNHMNCPFYIFSCCRFATIVSFINSRDCIVWRLYGSHHPQNCTWLVRLLRRTLCTLPSPPKRSKHLQNEKAFIWGIIS